MLTNSVFLLDVIIKYKCYFQECYTTFQYHPLIFKCYVPAFSMTYLQQEECYSEIKY